MRQVKWVWEYGRTFLFQRIVKSISCATASLRIVVCTIAFGMGINCAGVNQVIHWRPSADVECYMQECDIELGEEVRHLVQSTNLTSTSNSG